MISSEDDSGAEEASSNAGDSRSRTVSSRARCSSVILVSGDEEAMATKTASNRQNGKITKSQKRTLQMDCFDVCR